MPLEFKKNFTENWIVLLGIVLLFVAFHNYKSSENLDKIDLKEITTKQTGKKNLIYKPNTATEKEVANTAQTSTDSGDEFTNSSTRFKLAIVNKIEYSRRPAQANSKIFLAEQNLLNSTRWKIWLHTQVVKKDDAPIGQSLAHVSNFSIIESQDNLSLTEFDANKPIAVFDERLKKPGIITGTLKIQTSDKARLQTDLINYQAQVTDEFYDIETYFVKSTQNIFNLEWLYQNLKNQTYIKSVELEILSKSYDKN
jgi:hypothetical protein